jgi:hypothetical protein
MTDQPTNPAPPTPTPVPGPSSASAPPPTTSGQNPTTALALPTAINPDALGLARRAVESIPGASSIDEGEWVSIFDALLESGDMLDAEAALAKGQLVGPDNRGQYRYSRRRTLAEHVSRNPAIAELVAQAQAVGMGRARSELYKIAFGEGDVTIDLDKQGNVTRRRADSRNKLTALLRLLEKGDPAWTPGRAIKGGLVHAHLNLTPGQQGFTIDPRDVLDALDGHERTEFMRLLEKVEQSRRTRTEGTPKYVESTTHKPA